MTKYRTLANTQHMADHARATSLHNARLSSEASLSWDFLVKGHALFCLLIPEIHALIESIYQKELTLQRLWSRLPGGAQAHYLRSLLQDEVVATNEIEGVRSTRAEIRRALRSTARDHRFQELAHLYESLSQGEAVMPATLEEIREIYDLALSGEDVPGEDQPDGELFRSGPVQVWDERRQRAAHNGFHPEGAITMGLREFLAVSKQSDLVSAFIGHLMFEVAHPFYDGNGRTGRYLLSVHIASLLSPVTALTLSREINARKTIYYTAFTEFEDPLNRAEGTHFVLAMLKILRAAQEDLDADLRARRYLLDQLNHRLDELNEAPTHSWKHIHISILHFLGQISLFGDEDPPRLKEIADHLGRSTQQTRRDLRDLEDDGLVSAVHQKPLRFLLTSRGQETLGIAL